MIEMSRGDGDRHWNREVFDAERLAFDSIFAVPSLICERLLSRRVLLLWTCSLLSLEAGSRNTSGTPSTLTGTFSNLCRFSPDICSTYRTKACNPSS